MEKEKRGKLSKHIQIWMHNECEALKPSGTNSYEIIHWREYIINLKKS